MATKKKFNQIKTAAFRSAGTAVCIRATPLYRRREKTGIVHAKPACGVLMEDARIGPQAGWDVYDVRLLNGKETSAYGFDLNLSPRRKRRR